MHNEKPPKRESLSGEGTKMILFEELSNNTWLLFHKGQAQECYLACKKTWVNNKMGLVAKIIYVRLIA